MMYVSCDHHVIFIWQIIDTLLGFVDIKLLVNKPTNIPEMELENYYKVKGLIEYYNIRGSWNESYICTLFCYLANLAGNHLNVVSLQVEGHWTWFLYLKIFSARRLLKWLLTVVLELRNSKFLKYCHDYMYMCRYMYICTWLYVLYMYTYIYRYMYICTVHVHVCCHCYMHCRCTWLYVLYMYMYMHIIMLYVHVYNDYMYMYRYMYICAVHVRCHYYMYCTCTWLYVLYMYMYMTICTCTCI